jgi:predicted transposase YdaD
MYDSTCKFIAIQYSQELATWLFGKPLELTEVKPSELSLEPIRADSVIFLESTELILHLEFQTEPNEKIPYLRTQNSELRTQNYPALKKWV